MVVSRGSKSWSPLQAGHDDVSTRASKDTHAFACIAFLCANSATMRRQPLVIANPQRVRGVGLPADQRSTGHDDVSTLAASTVSSVRGSCVCVHASTRSKSPPNARCLSSS